MNPFNALRRKPDEDLPVPKTALVQQPAIDKQVKAVLAEFADLRTDRDACRKMVADARDHIVGLNEELARQKDQIARQDDLINRLQENLSEEKSRTTVYQIERDEAVVKSANATAELGMVMKQLKTIVGHNPEPVASDAENSIPALDYKAPRPPTPDEMIARINGKSDAR